MFTLMLRSISEKPHVKAEQIAQLERRLKETSTIEIDQATHALFPAKFDTYGDFLQLVEFEAHVQVKKLEKIHDWSQNVATIIGRPDDLQMEKLWNVWLKDAKQKLSKVHAIHQAYQDFSKPMASDEMGRNAYRLGDLKHIRELAEVFEYEKLQQCTHASLMIPEKFASLLPEPLEKHVQWLQDEGYATVEYPVGNAGPPRLELKYQDANAIRAYVICGLLSKKQGARCIDSIMILPAANDICEKMSTELFKIHNHLNPWIGHSGGG
jgi:hypothetical protein